MPASSQEVPVIEVKLEVHPNADKLALVRIDATRVVGVRKDEWNDGDFGAFIQADMVVPDNEAFKWVGKDRRIRPRKFRGVMSWGILVPAPRGSVPGDNVGDLLGITRYEAPEEVTQGGECEKAPSCNPPVYDLESWYKYQDKLVIGEPVTVTEKLHGANARYLFWDNEMHVGSHRQWKRQDEKNMWWKMLAKYPAVEIFCRLHPGETVYGEVIGTQDLKYDLPPGDMILRVFDIRTQEDTWWPTHGIVCCSGMPAVPVLYTGPYDPELVKGLISGKSTYAEHMREGIVIAPIADRGDLEIGRVKLKAVSMEYLERRG